MNKIIKCYIVGFLMLVITSEISAQQPDYDVIVYGATSRAESGRPI